VKKKVFWILVIILIALVLGVVMFRKFKSSTPKKHGRLTQYQNSVSSDMNGGHKLCVVAGYDDEYALITFSEAEWHNQDSVISEYLVPITILDEISSIYDEAKMYRFPDLKPKYEILDGGSLSYSFSFDDPMVVSFSGEVDFPEAGNKGLKKISDIIRQEVSSTEVLPGLVINSYSEEEMDYDPDYKEGEVNLRVYEYSRGYLNFRLTNGLDTDIEIKNIVTVYKLNGDDKEEIYHKEKSYNRECSPSGEDNESVNLKNIRLEPGKYLLTFDTYETEFEIK